MSDTLYRNEAACHLMEVERGKLLQSRGLDLIGYIDTTRDAHTIRRRDFRCRTCRAIVSFESERKTP